ncbi:PIN domain-containing protein [Fictibacillus aquaticus]|uniref:PIN domain-containing protein n=1 Tax=Fictibacillus aquaticus TaxID=2021314 RepID=A0A235F8L9_9BACL|nr:PIN domain-containing protein [Fictibacillus aquaticus]OYD57701.1 hypothetical protein CGZ90_13640 [Fictibacillus aquaticus]
MGFMIAASMFADISKFLQAALIIILHFGSFYYLWSVHPKIFKSQPLGWRAVLLSAAGFGLGQVYNRQLVKGIIFVLALPVILLIIRSKEMETNFVMALLLIMLFDAGISAKSARLRVLKLNRKQEVKKKMERILNHRSEGYGFGVDTNLLMHEPDLMVDLLYHHQFELNVSMQVISELDGLKKSDNPVTRKQAQLAFDVIEEYQKQQKVHLLEVPDYKTLKNSGLDSTPDAKIIGSYKKRAGGQLKMMFLSNDKGARIIARNAGMSVFE